MSTMTNPISKPITNPIAHTVCSPISDAMTGGLVEFPADAYFHGEAPEVEQMSHEQLLELTAQCERQRHWLDATQARALAAMTARAEPAASSAESPPSPPSPLASDPARAWEFLRDEVALAVGWSFGVADDRISAAVTLTRLLPATLHAVEAGDVSYLKAQHLARAVKDCDPRVATQIETRVLPRAGTQNLPAFQKSVKRAVLALDPTDRHQKTTAERAVTARDLDDGMALIQALVPTVDKATIMLAINAVADTYLQHNPADHRTADQRRADALAELGRRHRRRAPNSARVRRRNRAQARTSPRTRHAVVVSRQR